MLFGVIIAIYSESHMKSTNKACEQTADLLNFITGYTCGTTVF